MDIANMDITIHIPENCEPYAVDIKRFVDAMVFKLRKNSHKGRWEDLKALNQFDKLKDEVIELLNELQLSTPNAIDTMFEAADVANFAMIISSIVLEKPRG